MRKLFERGELKAEEPVEIWGTLNDAPELAPDRIYLSVAVEKVATLGKERAATGVTESSRRSGTTDPATITTGCRSITAPACESSAI